MADKFAGWKFTKRSKLPSTPSSALPDRLVLTIGSRR